MEVLKKTRQQVFDDWMMQSPKVRPGSNAKAFCSAFNEYLNACGSIWPAYAATPSQTAWMLKRCPHALMIWQEGTQGAQYSVDPRIDAPDDVI